MRKLILSVLFLFFAFSIANAQFKLTHQGFVCVDDETKDYVVIDVPDTPKDKLFQTVKMYLNTMYNNPKFVSSEVENEQIVIDAVDPKEIKVLISMAGANIWQFEYKYTISFKDNKIKFSPMFKSLVNKLEGGRIRLVGVNVMGNLTGLFNKNGKCFKDKAKEGVENSVNQYVAELIAHLQNPQKEDDNW
jgi:hypothetical protein